MIVTKTTIFEGCLLASISHAIMNNVFPELSYEQSWDGCNYSMQNSLGLRGTITFEKNYCVGAVRNEKAVLLDSGDYIRECVEGFPQNVTRKAYEETLQYLLLENNGVVLPYVTSIFWADLTTIHFAQRCIDNIKNDFVLFENILLPKEEAINRWKQYYGMHSSVVELIDVLYTIKREDFFSTIVLSTEQKKLIPGAYINSECIESFKEMNIIL